MLKTTIEDAGSENDTQSQKEAFQQIRREIATSSDITEQQQLQIIHDEEAERQKEEERITNQEEQMEREKEMVTELAQSGVTFAYETALLAAAKKKDLRATELLEFVAKKIENFGRQWNSGYINKDRYLSPTRMPQPQQQDDSQSEAQETNYDEYDIKINQDEWEGDIAEAWPSPTSQSYDEGSAYGEEEEVPPTPSGITTLQAIHRGNLDRERVRKMQEDAGNRLDRERLRKLQEDAEKNGKQNEEEREAARKEREALDAEKARLAEEAARLEAEKARLAAMAAELEAEKMKIEEEKRRHRAATKIQAAHRGVLGRKRIKNMHHGATKKQALYRGHVARKRVKKMKEEIEAAKPPPVALVKKEKRKKKKVYKSKNKLPLSKVKDYIAGMYEKKVKADMVDDKKGNERDTLEEFCDDFFSQMFGMPALAGKKRYELEQGVKRFQKDDEFVRWYGTLIGWLDDDVHEGIVTPFKEEAIDAYLYVLSKVVIPDAIEETLDDDPCLIKFVDVKSAIEKLFKKQLHDEKIKTLEAKIEETVEEEEVEFEETFDLIMRTWYEYEEPIICPKLPKDEEPKAKEKEKKGGGRRRGKGGRRR